MVSLTSAAGPEPTKPAPTTSTTTTTTTSRPPQTPNQAQSRPTMQPSNQQPSDPHGGQPSGDQGGPVMFFSARSIQTDANQNTTVPLQNRQIFDPKADSPSIRKTPGIDHTSSKPVARNGQHVPPGSQSGPTSGAAATGFTGSRPGGNAGRGGSNMVNPSLENTRRIGAPGGPGSPLTNRGSYKPPTMKRPLPGEANGTAGTRVPLSDVATNAQVATTEATAPPDGVDAKRQKTT